MGYQTLQKSFVSSFILTLLLISLIKQTTVTLISNPKAPFSISISPLSFSKLMPKLNWVLNIVEGLEIHRNTMDNNKSPIKILEFDDNQEHDLEFNLCLFFLPFPLHSKNLFNLQQHHKMRLVAWHKPHLHRNKETEARHKQNKR